MRHQEPEGDLIPEDVAIRRGMIYSKDARGHIREAHQPHPFLIDSLLERRLIDHDQHFYGVQMITMRKVFLNDMKVKVGMLKIRNEEGAAEDKPVPISDTDYLKVLRQMRNPRWKRIVVEVCDEKTDARRIDILERLASSGKERDALILHGIKEQYGKAFDSLAVAIKWLWEMKKACMELGCNRCTGACIAEKMAGAV
jgi:hypothetical protein